MEHMKSYGMPNAAMQAPSYVSPAAMPQPVYSAPVNIHASYEEINIYAAPTAAKKPAHVGGVGTSTAAILVLYILLVIILRGFRG
ncbi:hypothetical protein [Paenibacillus sp. YYML68]|uniref:hypothetical protein n=1 Tax=Paenibacillus sp. YYML68 TaxID=2909250 RepID=UPI002492232E|nr:hypothetical protein [Paenibacillus sp. YYML68]